MGIHIVESISEDNWRRFVNRHPLGNIFHTPEMFKVFQCTKSHRPEVWAALNTDGEILALLLPIRISMGNGQLARFLTTRSVVYGSVLSNNDPEGMEGLEILLRTYVQEVHQDVLFTELRNLSDLNNLQEALGKHGFAYEDHLNYLISLNRPLDDIFQSVGRRTRKHIRRGLRKNEVMIEEGVEREHVHRCYEVLQQTYATARVPLADRSLFEAAFDILHPLGMVKYHLAKINGTYVAASVDLAYKNIFFGWYGGVKREFSSFTPNELLTWHVLQWGSLNGYHIYDFGGAGKPDEHYGVRDFKAKFGGKLVNYGRNTYYHSPRRIAISKVGYRIYRRLWNLYNAGTTL